MRIKKNIAVSDSGFLFNPSSGDSYSINPIGKEIIELIQNGYSGDKIVNEIVKNYRIDSGQVEKDFNDFVRMMKTYRIIED